MYLFFFFYKFTFVIIRKFTNVLFLSCVIGVDEASMKRRQRFIPLDVSIWKLWARSTRSMSDTGMCLWSSQTVCERQMCNRDEAREHSQNLSQFKHTAKWYGDSGMLAFVSAFCIKQHPRRKQTATLTSCKWEVTRKKKEWSISGCMALKFRPAELILIGQRVYILMHS